MTRKRVLLDVPMLDPVGVAMLVPLSRPYLLPGSVEYTSLPGANRSTVRCP